METAYTFDDVMFEPQYSDILSRKEVDLTSTIGNVALPFPLISANMADITEEAMVSSMYKSGGLGIIHRFMTIKKNVKMFKRCRNRGVPTYFIGVSVGVGESEKKRFLKLLLAGARTFCIDVAHGHHIYVKDMLEWIRDFSEYKEGKLTIIAGNVASVEGAMALHQWGAQVIKAGVGGGSCCQTRENTGVGIPQLSLLKNIRKAFEGISRPLIISDGGIKKTGDMGKALVYADAIMLGGFLSGTSETPGKVYKTMQGDFYKTMAGSASAEAKVRHGKEQEFVEGGIRQVPFRGHVKYLLQNAKENVRSTLSYSGARNLDEFRDKCVLVKISGGGKKESKF